MIWPGCFAGYESSGQNQEWSPVLLTHSWRREKGKEKCTGTPPLLSPWPPTILTLSCLMLMATSCLGPILGWPEGFKDSVFQLCAGSYFKFHVEKFLTLSLLAYDFLARRTSTAVSPGWKGGIILVMKNQLLRWKPINISWTVILRGGVKSIQSRKTAYGRVHSSLWTRGLFKPQGV